MKTNVETLSRLTANLEAARDELERLNEEEALFKWELSEFPQLQQMFILKEPYEKLWNTAWTFHQKNDEWMNGMAWFCPARPPEFQGILSLSPLSVKTLLQYSLRAFVQSHALTCVSMLKTQSIGSYIILRHSKIQHPLDQPSKVERGWKIENGHIIHVSCKMGVL